MRKTEIVCVLENSEESEINKTMKLTNTTSSGSDLGWLHKFKFNLEHFKLKF